MSFGEGGYGASQAPAARRAHFALERKIGGAGGLTGSPAGMVTMFAGVAAPSGWAIADGTIYNVADYPETGAALGATYGGDGVTTFGLPNLKGRVVVGVDAADTAFDTLGEAGGSADAVAVSHGHTTDSPGHGHTGYTNSDNHSHSYINYGSTSSVAQSGSGQTVRHGGGASTTGSDSHSHTTTSYFDYHSHTVNANGVSGVDQNLQPYLALNYIVRMA